MKSLLKLTGMVLGTAAFLALAVFGRGGFAAFFSHPALVAVVAVTFALTRRHFSPAGI